MADRQSTELAEAGLLVGRYRFLREVGRGATGRVLAVVDEGAAGAPRALKAVSASEAERLAWEFDVLARIAHPNLAGVHELLRVREAVGAPFHLAAGDAVLVEDLAEGVPADRAVGRVRETAGWIDWVRRVGEGVARALAAIHRSGLAHGDVKPANVVVGGDDALWLIDLGLARPPGAGPDVAGTPAFAAPECWQGERSAAADLYGLGATLHHLLGGSSPLEGTRSRSLAALAAVALAAPREAATLPPEVPGDLRRLVGDLLRSDPNERPSSAGAVAARLAEQRHGTVRHGAVRHGGGMDQAATGPERAMAIRSAPFVGHGASLGALLEALDVPGVVSVHGPAGSGRTRLVREAVRTLQGRRAGAGAPVPTFTRSDRGLPAVVPRHDTVVHLEVLGEGPSSEHVREAATLVHAARVGGVTVVVVLESWEPPDGVERAIAVGPAARDALGTIGRVALGVAPTAPWVAAAEEASGALVGRLVRLLADAVEDGLEVGRVETLRSLGTRTGDARLPESGRALAERLAVAGGTLPITAAGGEADARASRALVAAGVASFADGGGLRLRSDVLRALWEGLGVARRAHLAQTLPADSLDHRGRAFLAAAQGIREAVSLFEAAVNARLGAGDPEGAFRTREDAVMALGGASPALDRAAAEALRARGRYDEALDLLEGTGDAAAISRAEVLRLQGKVREAVAVLDGQTHLEGALLARAGAVRARLALDGGDPTAAARLAREAGAAADSVGAHAEALRAAEVQALAALYGGDPIAASELSTDALSRARALGDRAAEARLESIRATLALGRGAVHEAIQRNLRAFELADAAGERHPAASFLVNVGLTRVDAGEPGPALEALREGARRLALLGRDGDVGRALYNLGLAAFLVGDDDGAASAIRFGGEAASRAGDAVNEVFCGVLEAEMALRAGHLARARARIASAVADADGVPAHVGAVVASRQACILTSLGELEAADAALSRAAARRAETENATADTEVCVARARLALRRGDGDGAHLAATEGRAHAERSGTWEARLRANLVASEAAEAARDRTTAQRCLAAARTLLDRASATLDGAGRARLRAVSEYQRAFATTPEEPLRTGADPRWRHLVGYARRLTAERREGRLEEEVAEAAVDLAAAERALVVWREDDGSLRVSASRGIGAGAADGQFSRSVVNRAIDGAEPIATVDARSDARLDGVASVHALALRSVVAVPLRRRGEVAGALYLDDRLRPAAFDREDVALLADLADLASIALDGAELLRSERRQARRLATLQQRLAKTVESQELELRTLRRAAGEGAEAFRGIVAESASMRRVLALAERVAASEIPVLVTGESGTGKELVARAIHAAGPRKDAPFVGENCGAIPESLLESALFGHVRGAFTGAERNRVGLFEAAHGGTLFLDEIGEMSAAMQAKLLRALQDGEIRPVGSERSRKVDVRIVAATHRDLGAMVKEGAFREDLYYRLAVVVVPVPPLRERPEDVAPLVAHFVAEHAGGQRVHVDADALARLAAHAWPGNVRQLENEVRRALVLGGEVITPEDLSPELHGREAAPEALDLKGQVHQLEQRLIRDALDRTGGNQTQAAKLLGLSRYGLQKMMKRLGVAR